jgi:predicted Zn-dependent peptidase
LLFRLFSFHSSPFVPFRIKHLSIITHRFRIHTSASTNNSAGGPGKGMYSRLYTGLLRRHGWVSSASSFVQFFGESSLFGFYATCAPAHVEQLVSQLKEEATAMAGSVDTAELSRAKNSIKSGVLIDLESRSVACEDLASQVGVITLASVNHDLPQRARFCQS